eukprot:393572_1
MSISQQEHTQINKQTLLTAHIKQLTNDENNDDHAIQIVNILGGIDNILNEYLSNESINITNDRLNKLDSIVSRRTKISNPSNNNKLEIYDNDKNIYDKVRPF